MTLTPATPWIAVVLGILLYAIPLSPKVSEIGRLLFLAGIFAALFGHTR